MTGNTDKLQEEIKELQERLLSIDDEIAALESEISYWQSSKRKVAALIEETQARIDKLQPKLIEVK